MKTFNLALIALFAAITISCSNEDSSFIDVDKGQSINNLLSVSEAESMLRNFVAETSTKSSSDFKIKSHAIKQICVNDAQISLSASVDTIPVYEFLTETDGKQGYSVVIGDKRIEKVVVSVPYGSLSDTSFIEPLRLYFRDLPLLLQQNLRQYYAGDTKRTTQTKSSVETCYKFLSTTWGQGHPYNNQCPAICYFNAPAGCVAIAVAQILAYHQVPSNLNWNAILEKSGLTDSSDPVAINQVASLVAQIGTKVNMEYKCDKSDAWLIDTPPAISSYGLKTDGIGAFNIGNCVFSLQNGGPLIISSGSNGEEDGHIWVCDAWKRHLYDDGTYYDYLNMNWGWSGDSNGFYLVEEPTSFSAGGYLFNSNLRTILNIRK